MIYYHGTQQVEQVMDALIGGGQLRRGFHLTPDINVAKHYGKGNVIAVELVEDLDHAHFGTINKEGNFNKYVGNGVEVVLKTIVSVNELYGKLWDAKVVN